MRFRNLTGLTGLPIDCIRHRFRNEDVLTVLSVKGELAGREALLVATPNTLAVISDHRHASLQRWP